MKGFMPDHGLDLLNKVTVPSLYQTRTQLRRLLGEVELTRGELAKVLGVSRNTLRRWIDGTRNPNRSARRLIQLVERIHFSPGRLGGGLTLEASLD